MNPTGRMDRKAVTLNPIVESAPPSRKERIPLAERSNVRLARSGLAEEYEVPMSGREEWWRVQIRETPHPGAYELPYFLSDIEERPNTYRFKSDGRKVDPQPHGKGATLLPGAYNKSSFTEQLEKSRQTYSFRDTGRGQRDFLNFGKKDKDINVSPNAYAVEKYLRIEAEPTPSKHSMFKSQIKRFPTIGFVPKEGPPPGNYEYRVPRTKQTVSSSFKSQTPRFKTSHVRTPGPGQYTPSVQWPMQSTIANMGRSHGIFFTSTFT